MRRNRTWPPDEYERAVYYSRVVNDAIVYVEQRTGADCVFGAGRARDRARHLRILKKFWENFEECEVGDLHFSEVTYYAKKFEEHMRDVEEDLGRPVWNPASYQAHAHLVASRRLWGDSLAEIVARESTQEGASPAPHV